MKRIATALVLIPAALWIVLAAHPLFLLATVVLCAAFCFREYCHLAAAHGAVLFAPLGYALGALSLTASLPATALLTTIFLVFALALRRPPLSSVLLSVSAFAFGVAYCFGPWRSALSLHSVNPHLLVFVLAVNWVGDAAAFAVGKRWGKRKLAPTVSPGKTIEGALASLIASVTLGTAYLALWAPIAAPPLLAAIAAAANVAGQFGDLCESALKRGAGIKDSGSMLPGHGGWLDRLDATLFSLPVVDLLIHLTRQSLA